MDLGIFLDLDIFLDLGKFERQIGILQFCGFSTHLAHFVTFCTKDLKVLGNADTFHSKAQNMQKYTCWCQMLLFPLCAFLAHFFIFCEKSGDSLVLFTKSKKVRQTRPNEEKQVFREKQAFLHFPRFGVKSKSVSLYF